MPTDTFFNLEVSKREKVFQALTNEFTQSTLEDSSIKNIVTDAEIPRGSFYQYFTDKEDSLRYVIRETGHETDIELKSENLYDLILHLFDREMKALNSNEESIRLQLIIQIARSPRATTIFNEEITSKAMNSPEFNHLLEKSHMERLHRDQNVVVMELLIASLKEAMLKTFADYSNLKKIREDLQLKLKIIRDGAENLLLK